MDKLTLEKFEEAAEKVQEVTLKTNLVYSDISVSRAAIRYILSRRTCSTQVHIKCVERITR